MEKIKVLDYGHVRLVENMGSDLSIVRNARVSYDADWRTGEDEGKDEKLIAYLVRNRHTSPFESVQFTFDIKCPLFIARQWHRHRTWSYNEISARYSELPAEMYVPDIEVIGKQSETNKQMRNMVDLDNHALEHAEQSRYFIESYNKQAYKHYKMLIDRGVPRELARGVLPMNTYTHFFGTVDLHNLMHFIKLRIHPHAQYEIQQYAKALLELIEPKVSITCKYMREYYEI